MGKNIKIAQPASPTTPIFVKFLLHTKNSSSKILDQSTLWNQKGFWVQLEQISVQGCQSGIQPNSYLTFFIWAVCKGLEISQTQEQAKLSTDMSLPLLHNHILTCSSQTTIIRESSEKTQQNKSLFFLTHSGFIGTEGRFPLPTQRGKKKGPACFLSLPQFLHHLQHEQNRAKFCKSPFLSFLHEFYDLDETFKVYILCPSFLATK